MCHDGAWTGSTAQGDAGTDSVGFTALGRKRQALASSFDVRWFYDAIAVAAARRNFIVQQTAVLTLASVLGSSLRITRPGRPWSAEMHCGQKHPGGWWEPDLASSPDGVVWG